MPNVYEHLQALADAVEQALDQNAASSHADLHDWFYNQFEACDECDHWIPVTEPSEVNNYHSESCSLNQQNAS